MAVTDGLLIKVINTLVFFGLLGSNTYYLFGPTSRSKETYITPGEWVYGVWSLIHLLLFGFIVYQWFEKGKAVIVDKIQWRFALLAILNTVFIWFARQHWYILAFLMSILVSASVSAIYYEIKVHHAGESLPDELFIHLPFSLYHAWALVLVILSGFEAFGRNAHNHHAGVWSKVFVFLALLFLETTAVGYAFATREGDIGGAAVICWTLFAIFQHQHDTFIHWSALAFFILSTFNVLKAFVMLWRAGGSVLHDEERAPLIGGSS